MSEAKYRYNPQTLSYEKIETTWKERLLKTVAYIFTGLFFAIIFLFISYTFFDSPKEKKLKREKEELLLQYELLNKRIENLNKILADIQERDDNIYRVIFEAEPIPANIRKAGFGGANKYKELEKLSNSDLVIETAKKVDMLEKQIYIQSKSFDEIYQMAKEKENMLSSIPAIQPVSNKNLKRMASGFGYRIHPIYKTRKFHKGMDFSAPVGTKVYATGNGIVEKVAKNRTGYGTHVVINHGYGYKTIYAHLNKYLVKEGQKVHRGDLIGEVGNTGTSTAPHLHYEVLKNGKHVNPAYYYFNDLTPEEYDKMLQISSAANQSFD
ncbi:MAG: M23 family metallopeptidase [Bacteroidetes bacterium]|nr:MAG: M23 family metallopeptidase [Bacteroidota bacterium]